MTSDPTVVDRLAVAETGAPDAEVGRSWVYWIGTGMRRHLLPMALGFASLALVAVFTNETGRYVPDTHLDLVWSPGRLLSEQAFLWNGSHGLGRPDEQSWFVVTVFFTLVRGLGASPDVAERLFHAALLTLAGTGMAALVRCFRPRIGLEHLFAGLFFMFNPFTVNWLLPSVLFVAYALAPWFATVFVRGIRDTRPWRWAAVFALLLFVDGTINVPGLVYALVPVALLAVYLVHVERTTTWRHVIAWLARVGVLAGAVFAAAIVKYFAGRPYAAQNIATTETPELTNSASSWAESWRGLGYWLPYARGLLRPGIGPYFTSAATILATFVAPLVALAVLWRSRWRPRLFFAASMLVALVLMVGVYPPHDPSPYGRLLEYGYDHSLFLQGWRNSYKAGPGWAMGVAALFGVAVAGLWTRTDRRWVREVVVVAALVVVAVGSFPFWTNRLYRTADRLVSDRPDYWNEANAWLDQNATDGRVLLLPGVETPRYRWGTVGDAALDTARPYLNPLAFAPDTFQTANLLRSIDGAIRSGTLEGTVAPIARRLGVRYIVVQNDLDLRILDAPRPSALLALRRDPELRRIKTFGERGQNVIPPGDQSFDAFYEASLPPVEVYRVGATPHGPARRNPPLLVAGDGDAWPGLASDGRLDGTGPVVYTAASSTAELARALRSGAGVVISDTNRRRLTVATSDSVLHLLTVRYVPGHTLAPGQDFDGRAANPLFTEPDAQSVAVFDDATRVSSSRYGSVLAGPQPWVRPAAAFDGDPRTAWQVGGLGEGVGDWIQVDFKGPRRLSAVDLVPPQQGSGLHIARATLTFSDGSAVEAELGAAATEVRFDERETRWLRIRIDEVGGEGAGTVGFGEITVPGLQLAEAIRLPEDVFAKAEANGELRSLLRKAPITYQLDRARSLAVDDDELVLRRELRTISTHDFEVSGVLRAAPDTPDEALAALTGESTAGSSLLGGFDSRGATARDGDIATAWGGQPRVGEHLTTRFEPRPVSSVAVAVVQDIYHSRIAELEVRAGDQSQLVAVPAQPCPASGPCVVPVTVTFAGAVADEVTVEVTEVEAGQGPSGPLPVGIAEVTIDGASGAPADLEREFDGCATGLLSIDGSDVPLRLAGSLADLREQNAIGFRSCAPVTVGSGRHRVEGTADLLLDHLRLTSGSAARPAPAPRVRITEDSLTRKRVRAEGPSPPIVVSGQSYDADWRAVADGRDLGPPQAMDTQSGWVLPEGTRTVEMSYGPESGYRRALTVSVIALGLCAWLAVRRPRGRAVGRRRE